MDQAIAAPARDTDRLMASQGWVVFPRVLPGATLSRMRADADRVYALRRATQIEAGMTANMEGLAHHALGENSSFDDFVADLPLYDEIKRYFTGKFILLNFGATIHPPGVSAYTLKPHRDVRAFSGDYRLSLNMLVMLDDFTEENGATLLLRGSHRVERQPDPDWFRQHAEPVTGRAGDIVLFDSLVVHSGAPNRSAAPRRALTLCFGRPFMKPHMDWPRFLPASAEPGLTPCARQLLGYDARVPASLEEYFVPPERWTFKADQR